MSEITKNEKDLETKDFAENWLDQCSPCTGSKPNCSECCSILQSDACRSNFGLDFTLCSGGMSIPINNPRNVPCICHDICVQETRLISVSPICKEFPLPGIGKCRLGDAEPFPELEAGTECDIFITSAKEHLLRTCDGVKINLNLVFRCPSSHVVSSSNCHHRRSAILCCVPVEIVSKKFYQLPVANASCCSQADPIEGRELVNEIAKIDGSALTIFAKAEVVGSRKNMRIRVTGKVIDKLWKHDNLWVTGLTPYDEIPDYKKFTTNEAFEIMNNNISHCCND